MTDWFTPPRPVGPSRWSFPPPSQWPAGDVIATGGDLEPSTLIHAYRRGLFTMPLQEIEGALVWWSPDPRGILPLDGLRVTRSLRRSAKRYDVRVDTCFAEVVRACANPARKSGWITDDLVEAFTTLHHLGWAHSVEVFDRDERLAGALYGVRIGGLFAGESMFYGQRDASKVALMALVNLMRETGLTLLDVQWRTDHMASLGAIEVSRAQYLALLANALDVSRLRDAEI